VFSVFDSDRDPDLSAFVAKADVVVQQMLDELNSSDIAEKLGGPMSLRDYWRSALIVPRGDKYSLRGERLSVVVSYRLIDDSVASRNELVRYFHVSIWKDTGEVDTDSRDEMFRIRLQLLNADAAIPLLVDHGVQRGIELVMRERKKDDRAEIDYTYTVADDALSMGWVFPCLTYRIRFGTNAITPLSNIALYHTNYLHRYSATRELGYLAGDLGSPTNSGCFAPLCEIMRKDAVPCIRTRAAWGLCIYGFTNGNEQLSREAREVQDAHWIFPLPRRPLNGSADHGD
jgi:hypothetical protein